MITLTEDEKRMVFQLEGCRRYDAIQEIAILCQYTHYHDKRATAENLLKKLRELSEDDCRELICDIQRNYHLPWKARPVGEMIAVARQESGARKLEGHDIMALERFDPEVTHMIVFDVLSRESPVGDKGERMRLFLTESGYQKALENQNKAFIQILNHAGVIQGHLRYDRTDRIYDVKIYMTGKNTEKGNSLNHTRFCDIMNMEKYMYKAGDIIDGT